MAVWADVGLSNAEVVVVVAAVNEVILISHPNRRIQNWD